ncbi:MULTISPECIES: hypothetical protein [Chryseobacterium]|uniref:DNA topoisomerase (ATP-hydrolyzing) n=1 Tax=Chryseobacterium taihuense TaxID=1141221 RepID=A0A4U8WIX9_9FLAO|nr:MULTISPECIES: hypothetical protein [Chryseobacterium]QQV03968.1 hypothetical protein I6I61_06440 [Chryseobacterium sp. FDAARGOS 1104]VFB02678.1 DNA gyrase subunit B [Chryseobacterium taihuense]
MEEKKIYTVETLIHVDFRDHVKLRPQMYFKDCYTENNLNSILIGALCHAIDEHIDNKCDEIFIYASGNSLKIKYNAGMSLEKSLNLTKAESIMTKIGACSNEKKHLQVGHEFCHLGMAVINAASEKAELKTVWNKQKGYFIFEKGKTVFKEISDTDISENSTTINFKISKEIFGDFVFDFDELSFKINSLKEKLPNLTLKLIKL